MGEYKNGNKDGNGTETYADGSKYVGEWVNNEYGQGTYTCKSNGTIYPIVGKWMNNEKDGNFWDIIYLCTIGFSLLITATCSTGVRSGVHTFNV